MSKLRKTIGFLTPNLVGDYHRIQWHTINKELVKRDAHLIVFSPLLFYSNITNKLDFFKIFTFADKKNIDGLIISAGSLNVFYDNKDTSKLYYSYRGFPIITVADHYDGLHSVVIDNEVGMFKLVEHFIVKHNYKKIAFIKGPDNNQEANTRFNAYKTALNKYNIKFDSNLTVEGDFGIHSGKFAVKELIVKRGLKPDAIIGANDDMILGAYDELKSMNIKIPDDIAIGGFDDQDFVKDTVPPITSVRQPFDLQIVKAVDLIFKLINDNEIPEVTKLPASPVIRESCGCIQNIMQTNNLDPDLKSKSIEYTEKGYNIGDISFFTTKIMNSLKFDDISQQIKILLDKLDVHSCYISLYDKGKPVKIINNLFPLKSEMFFAYRDKNIVKIRKDDCCFETINIIPDKDFFKNKRRTVICSELIFQNDHYGFLVIEQFYLNPTILYLFKLQLTNCFQYIYIHDQIEEKNKKLNEKSVLKSRYLANMSHEIRTPLHSILGNNEYMMYSDSILNESLLDINNEILEIASQIDLSDNLSEIIKFCKSFNELILTKNHGMEIYYYYKLQKLYDIWTKNNNIHKIGENKLTEINKLISEIKIIIEEYIKTKEKNIQGINKSGHYLLNLINTILDISKIEADKFEIILNEIKIDKFIEDILVNINAYRKKKKKENIKILININKDFPKVVFFDYNKIKQVILNLLSNAVKFTDKGKIILNINNNDEFVIIKVKDTGIGIKNDELKLIFNQFERTSDVGKIEGTGLGLSLSKKIIELHGGKIEVNSVYKKGSEFTIFIPIILKE